MLHHLEIYVSNLSKSSEFWGWLLTELEYNPYQKWESGISWKQGETYLVFVQAEERFLDVPYHRSRVGLNHLAFHAVSKEQVDQITTQLKDKGVNILYKDIHPFAGGDDHYAVFFEDPDRIKVELVAPKKVNTSK
ncbi:VOC family protein [Bacillus sp. sid0103]|uniref:VOC family protein n=1 Tax=Bacillus sp. sid0103 TaxID=2856337 RepID=UPI001C449D39|nr:VOC family protein [Bacillus sp. sid0103]MBV7508394.1 VOC family protein [Bacillus sp. sid0103]